MTKEPISRISKSALTRGLAVVAATWGASLIAQPVTAPQNTTSSVGSASSSGSSESSNGATRSWSGGGTDLPNPLLIAGPFTFHPHVDYRFLYGNGIQSAPGRQSTTAINSFSPGLATQLGTRWNLDYTPTWTYYSNHTFHDTVNHSLVLTGNTSYEALNISFSHRSARATLPLAETGTQTKQSSHTTSVDLSYQFTSQLVAQSVVSQSLRFADGFTTTRDWNVVEYLHVRIAPDLDAAGGVKVGYIKIDPGTDMQYTQVLGRIAAHPSQILTFQLQGGLESRTAKDRQRTRTTNPIISGSIEYHAGNSTTLTMNADRSVAPSYFVNQTVRNERLGVGVQQQLAGGFTLALKAGHQKSKYAGLANSPSGVRNDNNFFFDTRLGFHLLRRFQASLFYLYNDNSSSRAGFGFTSNQFGFDLGYRF